jgi:hypothetical protein
MAKAVAVFGSETWTVAEMDMKRLRTWNGKILRRIRQTVAEQGIWRMRTNQEQTGLYKDPYIKADAKKKRLEWTGQVVGMDRGRTLKKYLRVNRRKLEGGEL